MVARWQRPSQRRARHFLTFGRCSRSCGCREATWHLAIRSLAAATAAATGAGAVERVASVGLDTTAGSEVSVDRSIGRSIGRSVGVRSVGRCVCVCVYVCVCALRVGIALRVGAGWPSGTMGHR